MPLSNSPIVTVYAQDGSGTLTPSTATVTAGQTSVTIDFTYSSELGGVQNGDFVLIVPPGWAPPSTNIGDPGYTTSTAGIVKTSGRKITVPGITVPFPGTFTITYGASSGVTVPSTLGPQTWTGKERSTHTGVLTQAAPISPVITIIP
jgi:hypothetical protein